MKQERIRGRVEALVRKLYDAGRQEPLSDQLLLLDSEGSFDSVTALQLLLGAEEEFGIVVQDEDIQPENFKSIACLTRFIESKLSSKPI